MSYTEAEQRLARRIARSFKGMDVSDKNLTSFYENRLKLSLTVEELDNLEKCKIPLWTEDENRQKKDLGTVLNMSRVQEIYVEYELRIAEDVPEVDSDCPRCW